MQVPMSKIEIIGPKRLFFDTVTAIHHLGMLHVEDMSKHIVGERKIVQQMTVDDEHSTQKAKLDGLLARVGNIIDELEPPKALPEDEMEKIYRENWKESAEELAGKIDTAIADIEDKTSTLAERKKSLEAELSILTKYEPILEKIKPLAKQVQSTEGFETIALLLERRFSKAIGELRDELERITHKQCELVTANVDEETTAALVIFNKTYADPVHRFLAAGELNEVRLPQELAHLPFDTAYDVMKERKHEIPAEVEDAKVKLKKISDEWYVRLSAIKRVLADKAAQLSIIPQFGQTEYAFVITGWLPTKEIKNLNQILQEKFGRDVTATKVRLSHDEYEDAPVALKNPKWAEPFQFFYKLVSPPRYGTVDPTAFVAIYFPILFGYIVGDFGYGLVIFLAALYIRRRLKDVVVAQVFTSILLISSVSAMIFGFFLYFEFFGTIQDIVMHKYFHIDPHHWKPFHNIGILAWWPLARAEPAKAFWPLLGGALSIGVTHLGFGFIFGAINAFREHQMKHAIEKAGYFVYIVSLVILVLAYGHGFIKDVPQIIPQSAGIIGVVLASIGIVGIIYGGGVHGAVEVFGTVSNIISYARLMAVGLAGVIMAFSINVLAMKLGGSILGLVLGLILAVFLHTINVLVIVLSPSVHSLRLNLVECFSKFFHSASAEYVPFKRTGGE